jgi:hypothetical protein
VSLKAIPLTLAGTWPSYVEALYKSFGDMGGLFIETSGAVTEDAHVDGIYDYTDAEFANISGNLHGKVFATPANSLLTAYYMFSIKHGDDIGIVTPYCQSEPTMPGKLEIYTYDAVHGMPTGTPTTVTFSAITGTTVSTIVSLAKIGTKYHAVHLAYKRTVSGTPGELAVWGVVHSADGTIDTATKVENFLTYDTLKVPSTYLANLGYATQNQWTVRIEKAGTAWTHVEHQIHQHLHGDMGVVTSTVHEVTIDGVDYYEATPAEHGVDTETPTIAFRFKAGLLYTDWSAEYSFGDAAVLLDTSSSTIVCYVERASKALGYGIRFEVSDDDPAVWKCESEVASDSGFVTKLYDASPLTNIYYATRPFLLFGPRRDLFVALAVTDVYFRARVQDCDAVDTAWSTTLHLVMSNTIESVSNREDMNGDTVIGEAWDANYVQVKVTPWSDDTLQIDRGFSRMQIRNIANADTLFTAFNRLTSTVVAGELTEVEENELVAVGTTSVVQKALTDTSSGGFYADDTMSGENGVSFLTYDWDTGSIFYHTTFDDAEPIDLGFLPATPAWWVILDLKGTLCVAAVGYMGTVYYKPPTAEGDWQTIADSENVSMHYMSIDPWGKSFYFGDEENGLILRYVTTVSVAQSNAVWYMGI